MNKTNKKVLTICTLVACLSMGISTFAAGTANVNLTQTENFAESAVVRRENAETVIFKGEVLITSNKKGTFVARYQRNGSWYKDSSTAQKAISPGKHTQTTQASLGHKYYTLRIVSGSDTIGFGNTGTIAKGSIQTK